MDETMKNQVNEVVNDDVSKQESGPDNDNALKGAIDEQLKKIQRQNLLIGAQTICSVVLQKITAAMNKPGKRTMNDYKRLIKDIENFCHTGISRKINADGEAEPIEEESNGDNSTKLMEELNEGNIN